jgi:hypothetical protein
MTETKKNKNRKEHMVFLILLKNFLASLVFYFLFLQPFTLVILILLLILSHQLFFILSLLSHELLSALGFFSRDVGVRRDVVVCERIGVDLVAKQVGNVKRVVKRQDVARGGRRPNLPRLLKKLEDGRRRWALAGHPVHARRLGGLNVDRVRVDEAPQNAVREVGVCVEGEADEVLGGRVILLRRLGSSSGFEINLRSVGKTVVVGVDFVDVDAGDCLEDLGVVAVRDVTKVGVVGQRALPESGNGVEELVALFEHRHLLERVLVLEALDRPNEFVLQRVDLGLLAARTADVAVLITA